MATSVSDGTSAACEVRVDTAPTEENEQTLRLKLKKEKKKKLQWTAETVDNEGKFLLCNHHS